MEVKVIDRLAPFDSHIGNETPTILMIIANCAGNSPKLRPRPHMLGSVEVERSQRLDVYARNHKDMLGSDWIDVPKSDDVFCIGYTFRRNLPGDQPAKKAIGCGKAHSS